MSEQNTSRKKERGPVGKLGLKTGLFLARKAMERTVGKDNAPAAFYGLTEDAILSSRLGHPDDTESHLLYRQASAGQWLAYDFRRPEFFPDVYENRDIPQLGLADEGILRAMMIDGIEEQDADKRTDMPLSEWLSLDNLMTLDQPGIEKLRHVGMVALRSHEVAYEIAGQQHWIDDLRSRGLANEPVYQVTPKAHTLIMLMNESGKKTRKKDKVPQTETVRVPGILAH